MTRNNLLMLGAALYATVITVVVWSLWDARSRMTATYQGADQQAHWDNFRQEMDRRHTQRESLRDQLADHSGQPIAAVPPKKRSERPPTLELLENHFAACLGVSVVGVTLLFGIAWGFFMGAMLRPGRRYEEMSRDSGKVKSAD